MLFVTGSSLSWTARALVVFCLARIYRIQQKLRRNVAVPNKRAVDIESYVQQVLVVTRQDLKVWALLAYHMDLSVSAAHVTHAVLHRKHSQLRGNVQHGLQIVRRVRVVRVLEQDQRRAAGLINDLVPVLRRAGLVSEAQPAVRWIKESSFGPYGFGTLGFLRGDSDTFAGDAGDDGDPVVEGLDGGADGFLLGLREEGAFAGVAEDHEAFDAIDAAESGSEALDGFVVDAIIFGEGHNGGCD
jgi:hypothetical protein